MKSRIRIWLKVTISSILILIIATTPVSALTDAQWSMFNANGIYYWNPEGGCISSIGSGTAGVVAGEDNEAKIWNYFATSGIEELTNNPAAIAGIMGNIQAESSFNPYNSNGTHYGLYQTNKPPMITAINELGGNYWVINQATNNAPIEINDEAIKVELDYLVTDEFMPGEKRFADYLESIRDYNVSNSADGAIAAAELFEVAVERAHSETMKNGAGPLITPEAQALAGQRFYPYWQGVEKRRNYAADIYNKFVDYDPTTVSSTPTSYCGSTAYIGDGIPQYFQCGEKWSNLMYGPGGIYGNTGTSICAAGCGPTSFAMMATALLGRNILPDEVADYAGQQGQHAYDSKKGWIGSYHSITRVLARKYELQYEQVIPRSCSHSDIIDAINQYLREGWMIHTSGEGKLPFTNGGHYIGITGINSSGEWYVADSSSGNKYYPPEVVAAGIRCGKDGSNIWAIRR